MKKKLSTRIFSIFLSLLMVVSILPAGAITAQAANGVSKKIAEIAKTYYTGSYFSTTRRPCGQTPNDQIVYGGRRWCKQCNIMYMDRNTFNACGMGDSCWGFAHYVFYKVFNSNAENNRRTVVKGTDLNKYAKIGDYIRADGVHSFIYMGSAGSDGYYVYDSNGKVLDGSGAAQENRVNYKVKYSFYTNYPFSSYEIYHAYNYDKINDDVDPKPDRAPSIKSNKGSDVAKDSIVNISWNAVDRANSYKVFVDGRQVQNNGSRQYQLKLTQAKKYEITVKASNKSGDGPASNKLTITAHNPVKVTFKDYDGTVLNEQKIDYGSSAVAPTPTREGYTFTGWDKPYSNITSDTVITAQYKINTYTVKFLDKDGNVLKTEKVNYSSAATEPENKNIPIGYAFLGWDTQDYLSVKSNLTVRGIYAWGNTDLPIVLTNMRAQRQDDGYYVYFDLTNYPDSVTRGRAVVSLKTKEGKLIDTTESAAFSIPKSGTKTGMEVFIPCEKTATTAEIEIVNSYSSGVPISQSVTTSVDQGTKWSDWQDEEPGDSVFDVQTRTEYRYRDKQFTSSTATNTMAGWTLYNTTNEWSEYGKWSDWSTNSYSKSTSRKVETRTAYRFHAFVCSRGSCRDPYTGNCDNHKATCTWKEFWHDKKGSSLGGSTESYCTSKKHVNINGTKWWYELDSTDNGFNGKGQPSRKEYRYSDRKWINRYHFYRWNDWSNWSAEKPNENENREIEQKTVYRYVGGSEDTSGKTRTTSGNLDSSYAGKQATLFIYKVDEASDYSNEYVGQTTIADDGSYSFTYKLREEPTAKTGDFTIALGIEGTTNTMVIGTIEAPKPTYTVKFLSKDGTTILDTQTVTEGESAIVPEVPEIEGYTFTGWSENTTNIREDVEITAQYKENTYTVVFVDWVQENIAVREFTYGSVIMPPESEKIEGYEFAGWEGLTDETIATQNMIVTAKYDKETYTVNFYDFDGNIISTQTVEYKDSAQEPKLDIDENIEFIGWGDNDNSVDYTDVTENMNLYPQYVFKETTATPTADIESGEYTSAQKVTLNCATEDAVIYYTTDGSDPNDTRNAQMYAAPITISKSCVLKFVACSFERNDSTVVSNYYCVNNPNVKSEWMLYSQLPDDVKNNPSDYNIETEVGYRYKNVSTTSKVADANKLLTDGWTLDKTSYTDFTAWQNEEIIDDGSFLDLMIETQYVKDTAKGNKYRYSHYKYTDNNGTVQYSPTAVDGYDCTYENVVTDTKLSISGFLENNTAYYNHNDQMWFTQERVSTQYRSKYQIAEYYKWTEWDINAPTVDETRQYETDDVYRYANSIYHLVTLNNIGYGSETLIVKDNTKLDTSKYNNLYGYDFAGLYTDAELTNQFDLSSPITESAVLYAKYTPKHYQVLFQMEDGTELDMQTVEYLQSATAPNTDTVPGYVFGGWDKEFDCITEDTVITGKYFKESEYTRVSFDKTSATAVAGTSFILTATITPEDLANEEVEWSSSDPSVATVDENGKVTAMSAGTATITCVAVKTKEIATCTVKVLADDSSFILLKTDSSLNYDSLGYLRRIGLNTTVETVSEEFSNNILKFYNISGTELAATDCVGTGTQVKLFNGTNAVDTKTVVVTGDMTGDGIINNRDVAMMNKKLLDKAEAQECQMLAIDVNGDGSVNNKDAAMVARYLVGKEVF